MHQPDTHPLIKAPYTRKRFPAFLYCLLFSGESRTTSSLLETIQKRRKTFPCVRGQRHTLVVLDKLLASFYLPNKVNFQNHFANKLVFEAVQNTRSICFIGSKTLGYRLEF